MRSFRDPERVPSLAGSRNRTRSTEQRPKERALQGGGTHGAQQKARPEKGTGSEGGRAPPGRAGLGPMCSLPLRSEPPAGDEGRNTSGNGGFRPEKRSN
ncbi:MAG: hypothetical protein [Microviridae sp.]|nr:MAG: hypothetical protein [Microviridae sp.]